MIKQRFMLLALLGAAAVWAQDRELNVINSIRSSEGGVEIELHSSNPFLQSDLPVLRIGDQEFTISRSPEGGDLNTLIFVLTRKEFAGTNSGDPVTFQYGRGEGRNKRVLGPLDKSKLDK